MALTSLIKVPQTNAACSAAVIFLHGSGKLKTSHLVHQYGHSTNCLNLGLNIVFLRLPKFVCR